MNEPDARYDLRELSELERLFDAPRKVDSLRNLPALEPNLPRRAGRLAHDRIDGVTYDRELPDRIRTTLY